MLDSIVEYMNSMEYLYFYSHVCTFLFGSLVGAVGKYYADKCTDRRHKKEQKKQLQKDDQKIIDSINNRLFSSLQSTVKKDCLFRIVMRGSPSGPIGTYIRLTDEDFREFLPSFKFLISKGLVNEVNGTYHLTEDMIKLINRSNS